MIFRHLLSLVKPRIVVLLCLTGASAFLAAGGTSIASFAGFLVAGALVAGGSAALNCWYDRDLDRHMERTADRPLPSGDLSSGAALSFAVGLLAGGTVIGLALLPPVSVVYMWLGVLAYVGLYTILLKRRSRLGVVLGGSAGSFPVLAGWTAIRPLDRVALLFAGLVFVWTPAHAWALAYVYRDDFAAAGVPTLPAVSSSTSTARATWYAAVMTLSVAIAIIPDAGRFYATCLLVGSPFFLYAFHRYRQAKTKPAAVRAFFMSNVYLAVLFIAWALSGVTVTPSLPVLIATGAVAALIFVKMGTKRLTLRGIQATVLNPAAAFSEATTAMLEPPHGTVFERVESGLAVLRGITHDSSSTYDD